MSEHRCELCGSAVTVVSDPGGEGSNHYERVTDPLIAALVLAAERWRDHRVFSASLSETNARVTELRAAIDKYRTARGSTNA